MNNIAVITARSGSKGIKDKNIKLLNGKPLLAYSIEAALLSEEFKTVMVSTDSEQYAEIASQFCAEVPFLRSAKTSGDTAGSWDVIEEVLLGYEKMGFRYDTVCLLQPTSPLRTATDIIGAYEYYIEKNAAAVTGVSECDHPAEYMMCLDENRSLKEFRDTEVDLPRQMLPTYYRLNGAIFIRSIKYSDGKVILNDKPEFAYVMSKRAGIDIDTIEDFEYAEYLMKKNGVSV